MRIVKPVILYYQHAMLFIVLMLLAACSSHKTRGQQVDAQALISSNEIQAIVQLISIRLSTVLDKPLKKIPPISIVSPSQLEGYLIQQIDRNNPNQLNYIKRFSRSVTAIYSDKEQAVYVVPQNLKLFEKADVTAKEQIHHALLDIITHELIHAVQDQYGLLQFNRVSPAETRAFSTLVEGHAVMQTALILKDLGVIQDIYQYGIMEKTEGRSNRQQDIYNQQFSKKYIVGKKIFNDIHLNSGNEATWDILKHPSTEMRKLLLKSH